MSDNHPTITVGKLRQELRLWKDDDLICFSGLTFSRVKRRGEHLAQLEFTEQVYRDESGTVVVQTLE